MKLFKVSVWGVLALLCQSTFGRPISATTCIRSRGSVCPDENTPHIGIDSTVPAQRPLGESQHQPSVTRRDGKHLVARTETQTEKRARLKAERERKSLLAQSTRATNQKINSGANAKGSKETVLVPHFSQLPTNAEQRMASAANLQGSKLGIFNSNTGRQKFVDAQGSNGFDPELRRASEQSRPVVKPLAADHTAQPLTRTEHEIINNRAENAMANNLLIHYAADNGIVDRTIAATAVKEGRFSYKRK